TVLACEGKGTWLSRKAWNSWSYDEGESRIRGGKILVAEARTAIFSAPLTEAFSERKVEGRFVGLINLRTLDIGEEIRPIFRGLCRHWLDRLDSGVAVPSLVRFSKR